MGPIGNNQKRKTQRCGQGSKNHRKNTQRGYFGRLIEERLRRGAFLAAKELVCCVSRF
uniref:Uncharacterized protein n=1 Tax=Rhizophora mucronata TaxID=61149 RepID=A0A2P2PN86_RHIMU